MTNEQILNQRWKNIDEYLKKYLVSYKKINRKTRDKIQNVFNSLNIKYSDINKPISKTLKGRLERYLLGLKEKGLFKEYFGYKARLLLNKTNITYQEYLEIMLLGIYIEENKELDEVNNILFYSASEDSYNRGIKDIPNAKPISFKSPILYTILNIPILNATAEAYLYSLALTNAEELLKQTLVYIQLDKELNVDSKYYIEIFNKQQNRYILIRKDNIEDSNNSNVKMSGAIVNITENICNLSYLQAGKDAEVKKCRFIAERDKRTTKMCQTLDNQIFLIDDWNTYSRYSDTDKRNVIYKTYGLKAGENLPPINNHFHWCRSTISYQLDETHAEKIRESSNYIKLSDIEQYTNYIDILGEDRVGNLDNFFKIKYNKDNSEWEVLKSEFRRLNTVISGARNSGRIKTEETKQRHADMFYESVRKRTGDAKRISKNTGWSVEKVEKIREYVFIEKHHLFTGYKRFDPEYDMAVSWQRLNDGHNIQKHDLILLNHEYYEMKLVKKGYSQNEAHIIASKKYNFNEECIKYDRSKKNKTGK